MALWHQHIIVTPRGETDEQVYIEELYEPTDRSSTCHEYAVANSMVWRLRNTVKHIIKGLLLMLMSTISWGAS